MTFESYYSLDVKIPPIELQRKVVDAITPIEEKITRNNEINDNLLKQLNSIYDYWFTQFDYPNINGQPYRQTGGQMEFNKQLKINIPNSWSVKPLSELCDIVLGGTPNTEIDEYWNGNIHWLNSGEVAQLPVVSTELKITQLGIDNSSTKLMPAGTTIVSITGNIRTSYLAIDTCANQSVVGILENGIFKYPFIHQYLSRLIAKFTIISTGNCQQHINKGTIEDALVVIPDESTLNKYYEVVSPLYEMVTNLSLENEKLIHLRNWLLPMLMNGQATITD